MSDLPWIVKEFLLKLTVNPDCYTFVVMTSNNGKSGNSFVSLSQALSRSGANLSAVFDLQMPGNCLISSEDIPVQPVMPVFTGVPRMLPCLKFHF